MDLLDFYKVRKNKENLYQEIQTACRTILKVHPIAEEAREYVHSRVSWPNQNKFSFGYFPDNSNLDILYNYISPEKLKASGLVYTFFAQNGEHKEPIDQSVFNLHNITLPFRNQYGNIVTLVGRTILSEEERKLNNIQKYKYAKFDKRLYLFGLKEAKEEILKQGYVIIVEGQLDCITCHEYGIKNVVALGGTAFTKYQFSCLSRYTENICLMLDNDVEGQKAQTKISKTYGKDAKIQSVVLPGEVKDVDELLRKNNNVSIFNGIAGGYGRQNEKSIR